MSRKPRKSKLAPTPGGTHVFRCPGGVTTVKITEYPDHVEVMISGKHSGSVSLRVDREFERWMMPLLLPYEDDPRPVWIEHQDGGRRAFVHKLSDDRVVVATATAIEVNT
jgi:hypothetical protein